MRLKTRLAFCLLLAGPATAFAQPTKVAGLAEAIDKNGCATASDATVLACRADYSFEDRRLEDGLERLKREPFVDASRLGVYGFSRGGMAAALIAVRRDDLKAAVFGAGIYDFQRVHDDVELPGVRRNMEEEAGMTPEAVRARSAILRMDSLACPVLILHGEKDENVPVSQAHLLQERLRALGESFESRLFPDRPHGIGPEVSTLTVDFLKRKLAARPAG